MMERHFWQQRGAKHTIHLLTRAMHTNTNFYFFLIIFFICQKTQIAPYLIT
jgi:hypothetical protein